MHVYIPEQENTASLGVPLLVCQGEGIVANGYRKHTERNVFRKGRGGGIQFLTAVRIDVVLLAYFVSDLLSDHCLASSIRVLNFLNFVLKGLFLPFGKRVSRRRRRREKRDSEEV